MSAVFTILIHMRKLSAARANYNLHPVGIARHHELQASHNHFGATDTVPVQYTRHTSVNHTLQQPVIRSRH
jgi:hypothetical protein